MVSNFVTGFGLSILGLSCLYTLNFFPRHSTNIGLEVAANTFTILCGPQEHRETRLMFCQAVQATGSVLSGVLANKVFFANVGSGGANSSTPLINVQWTYLAITLLCAALGLFFFYMPLPEVSDQELEDSIKRIPVDPKKRSFFGLQLRTNALILAIMGQWLYTAAQESNSIFFRNLMVSILPQYPKGGSGATSTGIPAQPAGISVSIPDYLLIGHTAFAVSRFLVGYLCYLSPRHPRLPQPRTLLTISLLLSFLTALLIVLVRPRNPDLLVIPIMLFFFAEGPVWPLIFAIALRGQGRRTKRAAAFVTMGGSGGGVGPFIIFGIIHSGGTVRVSYVVIIVLQVLVMLYPLFLECVRDARTMVDPSLVAPEVRVDRQNSIEAATFSNRIGRQRGWDEKHVGLFEKLSKWKFTGPGRLASVDRKNHSHHHHNNNNREQQQQQQQAHLDS